MKEPVYDTAYDTANSRERPCMSYFVANVLYVAGKADKIRSLTAKTASLASPLPSHSPLDPDPLLAALNSFTSPSFAFVFTIRV